MPKVGSAAAEGVGQIMTDAVVVTVVVLVSSTRGTQERELEEAEAVVVKGQTPDARTPAAELGLQPPALAAEVQLYRLRCVCHMVAGEYDEMEEVEMGRL
ncbi:hypothetical protein PG996_002429 [Apiospora saccharicola]|uniref:Uncharacterized protein n=1 Tax=Apiospora saccharicola TaxID=335842 RepID=A0ABR1WJN1_9PEZI